MRVFYICKTHFEDWKTKLWVFERLNLYLDGLLITLLESLKFKIKWEEFQILTIEYLNFYEFN